MQSIGLAQRNLPDCLGFFAMRAQELNSDLPTMSFVLMNPLLTL